MFDFVFVVLVYRTTEDLTDFFCHFGIPRSKVIVVNSYYDDASEHEFASIAEANGADFLSVPNRGYGAGNNRGIEWAMSHYEFKYLVISNADIEIQKMSVEDVHPDVVNAPQIITRRGKRQNPLAPFYISLIDDLKYRFFCRKQYLAIRAISAINKIMRWSFYGVNFLFRYKTIYAPHGAFIIIPYSILVDIIPLFNEEMFLFAEEDHLARLCMSENRKIIYNTKIEILHNEDGSTGTLPNSHIREIGRESYVKYYEYWNHK